MKESQKILNLANLCIDRMEKTLDESDAKIDIKAINEYGKAMKTFLDVVDQCNSRQIMMEPIKVIMGEGEKYAN